MTMNTIYIKNIRGNRKYFATQLQSDISKEIINDYGIMFRCYSRNSSIGNRTFVITNSELNEIKKKNDNSGFNPKLYDYYEYSLIFVVKTIPTSAYIFVDNIPQLKNSKGDVDVFSAATSQIANETMSDKTKYAGRVMFQKEKESLSIEERDQKIKERDSELRTQFEDPFYYLSELQRAGKRQQKIVDNRTKKIGETQ